MGRRARLYWLLSALLVSLPLSAHKLKVFASAEGETIRGRVYFVGGAGARGAAVRVTDAEGHVLARLKPDGEGRFSYRVGSRASYRVVADSLDGHQASWTLQAEEFPASLPSVDKSGEEGRPAMAERGRDEASLAPQAALEAQVEQAVARQIRPLREALQAHQERVRLRDIIGGIGYIVGLAGLALWWGNRRKGGA
jgi:nickel transport protein